MLLRLLLLLLLLLRVLLLLLLLVVLLLLLLLMLLLLMLLLLMLLPPARFERTASSALSLHGGNTGGRDGVGKTQATVDATLDPACLNCRADSLALAGNPFASLSDRTQVAYTGGVDGGRYVSLPRMPRNQTRSLAE